MVRPSKIPFRKIDAYMPLLRIRVGLGGSILHLATRRITEMRPPIAGHSHKLPLVKTSPDR
jgi:hypothetical protein